MSIKKSLYGNLNGKDVNAFVIEKEYFEFISLINDEQQILSTNKLRYFEIEVEGFSMISIGVVDTLKFIC